MAVEPSAIFSWVCFGPEFFHRLLMPSSPHDLKEVNRCLFLFCSIEVFFFFSFLGRVEFDLSGAYVCPDKLGLSAPYSFFLVMRAHPKRNGSVPHSLKKKPCRTAAKNPIPGIFFRFQKPSTPLVSGYSGRGIPSDCFR